MAVAIREAETSAEMAALDPTAANLRLYSY
jgi:hypothetical protein